VAHERCGVEEGVVRPVEECVAAMVQLGNAWNRYTEQTRESPAMADFTAVTPEDQEHIIQLMFAATDALEEVADALRTAEEAL
jgi:hypothetical protein